VQLIHQSIVIDADHDAQCSQAFNVQSSLPLPVPLQLAAVLLVQLRFRVSVRKSLP